MPTEIILADYHNPQHQQDISALLNAYAQDPMGGGHALPEAVQQNLVSALAERPYAFSLIAYVDGQPAGLTNCFEGFSTFACKPLINIHDLVVLKAFRGKGISLSMLERVEQIARDRGCCKITLEVLSNNQIAQAAYWKFGFGGYQLDPDAGQAQFWQKAL